MKASLLSARGAPRTTIGRLVRRGALAATVAVAFAACSGGSGGGGNAPTGPSDKFFSGVVTGKDSSGAGLSGTIRVVLYDPALADKRAPGSTGSTPGVLEAVARLYLPSGTKKLAGTWDAQGGMQLSGDGWSLGGASQKGHASGKLSGPSGEAGTFDGQDIQQGDVAAFCGTITETGDPSGGEWSLTVSTTGSVTGTFRMGGTFGFVTGTAVGEKVDVKYTGDCTGSSPQTCFAEGTATGSIGAQGNLSGTWSGTHHCTDLQCDGSSSGTFETSSSCVGGAAPPETPADMPCQCTTFDGCAPCGICCLA